MQYNTLKEEIFADIADGISIRENKFPRNKKNSLIRKNKFPRKNFFFPSDSRKIQKIFLKSQIL